MLLFTQEQKVELTKALCNYRKTLEHLMTAAIKSKDRVTQDNMRARLAVVRELQDGLFG